MREEFGEDEWASRPAEIASVVLRCECKLGGAGYVFRCRAPRGTPACGRYVCECMGGGDDDRCADCWSAWQKLLPARLVRYVKSHPGVREDALCRRFGGGPWKESGEDSSVEEALYELVRAGSLEWYGKGDGPLRYRVRGVPAALPIPRGAACAHPRMGECHPGCKHYSCPDCGLSWDEEAEK